KSHLVINRWGKPQISQGLKPNGLRLRTARLKPCPSQNILRDSFENRSHHNLLSKTSMKLTIDNLQGQGMVDYTAALDGTVAPRVERKINQPARLRCRLMGGASGFVVPAAGGRVILTNTSGSFVF